MARKAKVKKVKSASQRKKFDTTHLGPEPTFETMPITLYDRKLAKTHAFNWYAYFYDKADSYDADFLDYCKEIGLSKDLIKIFKSVKLKNFGVTALKLIRMSRRGWELNKTEKAKIDEYLKTAEVRGRQEVEEAEAEKARQARLGPANKITYSKILYELDEVEDAWMDKEILEYSVFNAARIHNASKGDLDGPIRQWVQSRLDDMLDLKKKDEQCVEAYDMSAQFRNKIIAQLENFLADINLLVLQPKKKRAPRARKAKIVSADKKVEKLKYQYSDQESKLVSIDATKLLGAQWLVVFNTKYRALMVYKAADEKGLDVKGTTLQNVDLDKSTSIKLRKPDEVLPDILKTSSIARIQKIIEGLTTKASKPNARINDTTILMKALG